MPPSPDSAACSLTHLQSLLARTRKKSDYQRVLTVFLRARFNYSAPMVAEITGLKPGTVRKIWSAYGREGEKALFCKDRGGRRNAHLSREEEKSFLAPFFKKADETDGLAVAEVQEAYEGLVGKSVPKSTIYRLLSRHGWKRKPGRGRNKGKDPARDPRVHEYWIEGCAQVIHPERTGNISQQWLNSTLSSMVPTRKRPPKTP